MASEHLTTRQTSSALPLYKHIEIEVKQILGMVRARGFHISRMYFKVEINLGGYEAHPYGG